MFEVFPVYELCNLDVSLPIPPPCLCCLMICHAAALHAGFEPALPLVRSTSLPRLSSRLVSLADGQDSFRRVRGSRNAGRARGLVSPAIAEATMIPIHAREISWCHYGTAYSAARLSAVWAGGRNPDCFGTGCSLFRAFAVRRWQAGSSSSRVCRLTHTDPMTRNEPQRAATPRRGCSMPAVQSGGFVAMRVSQHVCHCLDTYTNATILRLLRQHGAFGTGR